MPIHRNVFLDMQKDRRKGRTNTINQKKEIAMARFSYVGLLLVLTIILALAACGSDATDNPSDTLDQEPPPDVQATVDASIQQTAQAQEAPPNLEATAEAMIRATIDAGQPLIIRPTAEGGAGDEAPDGAGEDGGAAEPPPALETTAMSEPTPTANGTAITAPTITAPTITAPTITAPEFMVPQVTATTAPTSTATLETGL
jgi:hypothetical protein